MSGAIHRTDIFYAAVIGDRLGVRDTFRVPDFTGARVLLLNLE